MLPIYIPALKKIVLLHLSHLLNITNSYIILFQEETPRPAKRLLIVTRLKPPEQWEFNLSDLDVNIPANVLMNTLLKLKQCLPIPVSGNLSLFFFFILLKHCLNIFIFVA